MSQPLERHVVLARLREEIRRIEHRPDRRDGCVPCGLAAVDAALPAGGFARGALAELRGGPASGKTAAALSLLAALGREELFAWVDGRGEIYPPAAAARGVDLGRLLVVRPALSPAGLPPPGGEAPWRVSLWAAEALLASGAFGAVVMDIALPRTVTGADAVGRRLQAATERGGAIGLWLSSPRGPQAGSAASPQARSSTAPVGWRVPAAVRLEISTESGRVVARRASDTPAGARTGGGGRAA